MAEGAYRRHLRAVVANSAAPYGYTLTIWTTGAITTHAAGTFPSTAEALLLLTGAVMGFGVVGAFASGGINGVLSPRGRGAVRVWGGIHLPSVGLSIGLVTGLTHLVRGMLVWPLVGFASTSVYLLTIAGQFWLATQRGGVPEPSDPVEVPPQVDRSSRNT